MIVASLDKTNKVCHFSSITDGDIGIVILRDDETVYTSGTFRVLAIFFFIQSAAQTDVQGAIVSILEDIGLGEPVKFAVS